MAQFRIFESSLIDSCTENVTSKIIVLNNFCHALACVTQMDNAHDGFT